MIAVFKTGVRNQGDADYLMKIIEKQYPGYEINFDLEDCDNILRVEANNISPRYIESLLQTAGFNCQELEY